MTDEVSKWQWLAARIEKMGFPSRKAFADQIGWPLPRVSEMINGTSVNDGAIRNFPMKILPKAAKALGLEVDALVAYNNNEIDLDGLMNSTPSNFAKESIGPSYDPDDLKFVLVETEKYLVRNKKRLTPEKKAVLIEKLLDIVKSGGRKAFHDNIINFVDLLRAA